MTALNFQSRFADAVASGRKTQTVRAPWKDGRIPFREGKHLQLYTGMRTKQCRRLGDAICTGVSVVRIDHWTMQINSYQQSIPAANRFAVDDGFENFDQMVTWFRETHGIPFNGYLIKWRLLDARD